MNTLLDVFLVGSLFTLEETPDLLAGRFADLGADSEDRPGPDFQHTPPLYPTPSAPR